MYPEGVVELIELVAVVLLVEVEDDDVELVELVVEELVVVELLVEEVGTVYEISLE